MDWKGVERKLDQGFRASPRRYGSSLVIERRRPFPLAQVMNTALSEEERGRVVGAILNPETPNSKAAALGIQLVNSVDPPSSAEVELSCEITSESIKNMSYSELLAAAERLGISLDRPDEGAIEGAKTPPTPPETAQPGESEAE
jgi:hypothetical protein